MSRRPFTLVEILLAMAIFVFAVGPLLGVMAAASGLHGENTKRIQAQMFASQIRAQLQIYAMNPNFDSNWDMKFEPVTGLAQVDRYRGLHYVLVSEREAEGLVQFKLGIAFRPPEDTAAAGALGGTNGITVSGLNPVQKKVYSTSSNIYQQRTGGTGGIFSSSDRSFPSATSITFNNLTKTPNNTPGAGTTYSLDYVFTLWVTR